MTFNLGMLLVGGRSFTLNITTDQFVEYIVESQLQSTFPSYGSSRSGDQIFLNVSGSLELTPASPVEYAIEASGLHSQAELHLDIGGGTTISGRGGNGGAGWVDVGFPVGCSGGSGSSGGDAIHISCPTTVTGSGTVTKGYGGGGGGDGSNTKGGGGGGGGAPYGVGGGGKLGSATGGTATLTTAGSGGSGAAGGGGNGGDGGDFGGASQAGQNTGLGCGPGSGGVDGDAVNTDGTTSNWDNQGSTTVVGAVV